MAGPTPFDPRAAIAEKLVDLGIGAVRVAAGALIAAPFVASAVINSRPFKNNLLGSNLTFPSDLDQYGIAMSFDFYQYTRRSMFNQPFMKPQGTIKLPVPKSLLETFTQSWEETSENPVVGAAIENMQNGNGASLTQGSSSQSSIGDTVSWALGGLGGASGGIAVGAAINTAEKQIQQGATALGIDGLTLNQAIQPLGLAVNPFLTVMFKQPNFKEYQFNWRLIANTPEESNIIQAILTMFKYHLLPDFPKSGFNVGTLLNYPDIVQLSFMPESDYLFKFKPCVIKSFSSNYAPSGPSFFKGQSNVPTEVEMSMNLLEIEYWSKNDINQSSIAYTGPRS
jgi:hypothetical protein